MNGAETAKGSSTVHEAREISSQMTLGPRSQSQDSDLDTKSNGRPLNGEITWPFERGNNMTRSTFFKSLH